MKEKSWTTFRRLLASPVNERDAISDTTVCVEGGGDGCYPNLAGRGRKREGGGRVERDEEGGESHREVGLITVPSAFALRRIRQPYLPVIL